MSVANLVVGIVPLSIVYISLSGTGSISSMYCSELLCMIKAAPGVYLDC